MKYEVNMSVRGRFTTEVDNPNANESEIKMAADQKFAEANFGELADIDAEFVNYEPINELEKSEILADEEMVKNWLFAFINDEIMEIEGDIANERLWALGSATDKKMHHQNIANKKAYQQRLRKILDEI